MKFSDKFKEVFKITRIPVLFASMCCLSPLLLVVFGLASVSFAAGLADLFYGTYKWAFRGFGLFLLVIFLILYFRKKGICTFDKVKRERNKIINMILLTLIVAILLYMFFLYVVVHYIGVWFGVWN